MKLRKLSLLGTLSAYAAAGAILFPAAVPGAEPPAAGESEGFDVLTRGPVHEAFAESVSFEPAAGIVITNAPPEPIEELPPEQELEGDNVAWIPGYWAWDEDEGDFLWISGIWRNLPPEREWVPGYWNPLDGGEYQWVSGYWLDTETEEVEYIATAPPESIDVGPNIEAPSEDHSWIPGNWVWQESRYLWRPGYWMPLRADWNWVPSRYCWTPRGYVYVSGYWDYAVPRRGVLFAPVLFHHHHVRPGFFYTPSIVVSLSVFTDHLFVRPRFGHYYFGDYYAPRYADSGFYASYAWHSRRHSYDPIYAHMRWHHRHDRDWDRRRVENFNYFRNNEAARPAHLWSAMRTADNTRFKGDGRNRQFASTLSGFVKDPTAGQRFRSIDQDRRNQFAAKSKDMRKFSQQRRQLETTKVAATRDSKKPTVLREKIRRSPIMSKSSKQLSARNTPPERPEPRVLKKGQRGTTSLPEGMTRKGKEPAATTKEQRDPSTTGKPERPERGKGTTPPKPATKERTPVTPKKEQPKREVTPKTPKEAPTKEKAMPKRQVQPSRPEVKETTKREIKPQKPQVREMPKREVQPQKQQPQRQVQPQKQQPQRQVQPQRQQPQRQVQPQRQQPQRQVQPQRQQPQRQVQPQRQQPQRQVQPQRQQPQRQVQPQRQQPSQNDGGKGGKGQKDR
ncbi:YXWGXW repeat-containing protein [Luteolibacter marinus]|uniref:YXWGXW repeat-containing protein n=1 Tax=Luteolibacter marinus TaxID=2776705 RepID=UPI001868B7A3|nr:YXWGXW repeat-containing protein [Luteolibacter marinus]